MRRNDFTVILIVAISILISFVCVCFYIKRRRTRRAWFNKQPIYYIVSSNENNNYLSFWPYVKNNVEKLGMIPILIYTGRDNPKDKLKGNIIYKPCPPDLPGNHYAQIIRLFAPSLFPDQYCVIADIDSIPLKREYFTDPLMAITQKNGWVFWNDWSLGADCDNWPMCFNLAKGSVWAEVFPYAWDKIDEVIQTWLSSRKKGSQSYFADQYFFGKYFCRWKKNNPHRFAEYYQNIYNMFIGPRAFSSEFFSRRIKTHNIQLCETLEEIEVAKRTSGVAWVSRLKDGMDKSFLKETLEVLKL